MLKALAAEELRRKVSDQGGDPESKYGGSMSAWSGGISVLHEEPSRPRSLSQPPAPKSLLEKATLRPQQQNQLRPLEAPPLFRQQQLQSQPAMPRRPVIASTGSGSARSSTAAPDDWHGMTVDKLMAMASEKAMAELFREEANANTAAIGGPAAASARTGVATASTDATAARRAGASIPLKRPQPHVRGIAGSIVPAPRGVRPVASALQIDKDRSRTPPARVATSEQAVPLVYPAAIERAIEQSIPAPVNKARSNDTEEQSLPHPWQRHWSEEFQIPFYFNPDTGDSLWEPPVEVAAPAGLTFRENSKDPSGSDEVVDEDSIEDPDLDDDAEGALTPPMDSYPIDENGEFVMPSVGSAGHLTGTCRPCHYIHTKNGCQNGYNCGFCHCKHSKRSRPRLPKMQRMQCQKLALSAFEAESTEMRHYAESELLNLTSADPRLAAYSTSVLRSLLGGAVLKAGRNGAAHQEDQEDYDDYEGGFDDEEEAPLVALLRNLPMRKKR